jgi:hypothetical protein
MAITFKQSEYLLFPQYRDCMTLNYPSHKAMNERFTVTININLFWCLNFVCYMYYYYYSSKQNSDQ